MAIEEKISAYIDGELSGADLAEVERLLETDPSARDLFARMQAADNYSRDQFSAQLEAPVPLSLAKSIMDAPEAEGGLQVPANDDVPASRSAFRTVAAAAVLLISAGAAGYLGYEAGTRQAEPTVVAKRGWLDDIADYHRVYATEGRHLVEVGPQETAHLEGWLGKRTNTPFKVPDLASDGLAFEGGRLLVAAGRPVAQLIYKDKDGGVFALCFTHTGAPESPVTFKETRFDDLEMVSWKKSGSSFVVVGPAGSPEIEPVAKKVSQLI